MEAKSTAKRALEEVTEGYAPDEEFPLATYAALIALFNLGFAAVLAAAAKKRGLPSKISAADLILVGVATHKLSRLVAKEKVTAAVRAPFTRYEAKGGPAEVEEKPRGTGARRTVGELLLCPYCLDQWIATGFVSGLLFAPRATRVVASVFATTAIADFLQLAYKAGQKKL